MMSRLVSWAPVLVPALLAACSSRMGCGPHARLPYPELCERIEQEREALGETYRKAQSRAERAAVVELARRFIVQTIRDDLTPRWLGTPWDFNGTTQTPKAGAIACGYFVTTILRDAGFRVERARLAQQASEYIIKSLTDKPFIKRFSNVPLAAFIDSVKAWGRGIYVVGLDIHTGFVINDMGAVLFVHSSYVYPVRVCREPASASVILRESKYRVLGKITDDDRLIASWLRGAPIATKT